MIFLIQTVGGKIVHDFAFQLIQSKEYYKFLGEELEFEFCEYENLEKWINPTKMIPIGRVDFVLKFAELFHPNIKRGLRPLNVPTELLAFAGRKITNINNKEDFEIYKGLQEIYIKSNSKIKDEFNGLKTASSGKISDWYESKDFIGFQVSEVIKIESEWRVFIFNGEILYISNYEGDSLIFPNPIVIKLAVKAYSKAPKAWTLDLAVTNDMKTVVLECHRFFSCGLYGFNDLEKLPKMFSQTWSEIKLLR